MSKTVQVDFDKDVRPFLPKWAQRNPKVLELCKRDVLYRRLVMAFKGDAKLKKSLIHDAEIAIR